MPPSLTNRSLTILFVAIALVSLWLRTGFPVHAISHAGHDDLLFVRLAGSLLQGDWLGPYDNLTLAKGPAYPAFIGLANVLGIPLKAAEQGLYLVAALAGSLLVARLAASRALGLTLFAVLALNPVVWTESLARIIREGLYLGLSLAVIVACLAIVAGRDETRWTSWIGRAAVFGLAIAAFWLTREEGIWLVPSLALLTLGGLAVRIAASGAAGAGRFRAARRPALALLAGVLIGLAGIAGVQTVNLARYGVFTTVEFKAPGFTSAYGALSRIAHEDRRRFVVVPQDARAKAYSVSPAAAELAPYLEGEGSALWATIGCNQMSVAPCPDILGGWFMWALRDAAKAAGHYESGAATEAYYLRMAAEIDAGCEAGRIPCGPRRATMRPPLRAGDLGDAADFVWPILHKLLTFDGAEGVRSPPSLGPIELRNYMRLSVGQISLAADMPIAYLPGAFETRTKLVGDIARGIATAYSVAVPILFATGLAGLALAAVLAIWRASRAPRQKVHEEAPEEAGRRFLILLSTAVLGGVAARVVLLAYLEVTSIPSLNILYLSPATPLVLVFVVVANWLGWDGLARHRRASRVRLKAPGS